MIKSVLGVVFFVCSFFSLNSVYADGFYMYYIYPEAKPNYLDLKTDDFELAIQRFGCACVNNAMDLPGHSHYIRLVKRYASNGHHSDQVCFDSTGRTPVETKSECLNGGRIECKMFTQSIEVSTTIPGLDLNNYEPFCARP